MRGGALRQYITIEQAAEVRNAVGDVAPTWSTVATVWAAVEPLSERELLQASQTYAERTVRFRLRYLAGVKPKMRVNWNSRLFDIHAVRNINERNAEMELLAVEFEKA